MPKEMCFWLFYGFDSDFLEFPLVKSSKPLTELRIQLDANLNHEKSRVCIDSFFDFWKFMSFTTAKKTGHDFR